MSSAARLRRVCAAALATATVASVGGSIILSPNISSNDRGSGTVLEAVRSKINDPYANVPSRAVQESALIGASQANPLDILVVGGGATGCGVAFDAVTRGLRVGLVEREDFSSGTSSRSTKLIHGGVRYLEKAVFNLDYGQLKLVFHALEERKQVIENAPHLCHALPCMTPCFDWFEVVYYWAGLKMYDLVAGARLLHLSRYYSAKESIELFPTLSKKGNDRNLRGTVVYYDGQMNDSRLNVGLACSAALAGAAVLNHAEVISFLKDEATGRVIGARIRDNFSGKEFETYAKVVVNAAGPFCDSVRKLADKEATSMICPSSGVHIVLPDYYSPDGMGLIVPKTKDGRVVFMLPWLGRTVAGTTDSNTVITPLPEPHEDEIQFILDAISDYLSVKVRRTDVLSAWSGIRPLAVDPSAKSTESISRDHVVCEDYPGLVTITGGKWTTYRRISFSMAEDAVDAAVKSGKLSPKNGSVTHNLRLMGGDGWEPSYFTVLAQQYVRMKRTYGGKVVPAIMDTTAAKHLSHAYGTLAERVAAIAQNEGLGKRLAHGYPFMEAEVAYCARNEYCESAVDFIARRSRLAFLDTDAAGRALPRVIEILAAEHKFATHLSWVLRSSFSFGIQSQLFIPWIIRGEDGNLKLHSHPPERSLHALTDAKTQPKKKIEEVRKGSGGNAKTKLEVEPRRSKVARRFYNEDFRDQAQRLSKVLAAAGVSRSSEELIFEDGSVYNTPQRNPGLPKPRLFTVGRLHVATNGEGTVIDSVHCTPDSVELLPQQPDISRPRLPIMVHEGRNHEIRELVKNAGLEIHALKHAHIGGSRLPSDLG
ncbi:glycerol-3-phosphate dehydrogenase SDP6 [Populus alba x Populus x berolinensis]|uniref:Glycerol-3-phosphate dehydrogenase n=1 Tax=Populus alba x Populus x berolinensis TaxID=444605 RepID=A0AAD6ME34_9ROSI|nr:glycerol-3-phosphate dehydrogenase SDP6 [Populus alba x Populus x berolinensis]